MGHMLEEELNWPPHSQNPLDIPRLCELKLDQSAIDLLQKIPWAMNGALLGPFDSTLIVGYTIDDDLELSRDPTNWGIDFIDDPQELEG